MTTAAMANFPEVPNLSQSFRGMSLGNSNHDDDSTPVRPSRKMSFQPGNKPISSPTPADLGYEDAAPTLGQQPQDNDADADANVYGYESASPTTARHNINKVHTYDGTKVPRRSSMKSGNSGMPSRRASIGTTSATVLEVRVRGERYPIQRRRSIDFQPQVDIREVTPVTAVSSRDQLWLQPEEFAKMKSARRALVAKHKTGEASPHQEEDDIRGLEKYIDRSGRLLKHRAWDVVLLEQDEQEITGVFNEERIADLYRSTTLSSPDKAAALAKKDHEAIQDYLMSPRTTKLMMRRLSC